VRKRLLVGAFLVGAFLISTLAVPMAARVQLEQLRAQKESGASCGFVDPIGVNAWLMPSVYRQAPGLLPIDRAIAYMEGVYDWAYSMFVYTKAWPFLAIAA